MTHADSGSISADNGTGTGVHITPPPPAPPSPGSQRSGDGSQPDVDQLTTAIRLLRRDGRPDTLEGLLFELGRHGLALGYPDGEPAFVSIGGAPHRSLRSLGLMELWIQNLADWDRAARLDPGDLEEDDLDPGPGAIDRLWSRLNPHGEMLTDQQIASVRKFLRMHPFHVVAEAVRTAAAKIPYHDGADDRFRYFAKILWNKLKGRDWKRGAARPIKNPGETPPLGPDTRETISGAAQALSKSTMEEKRNRAGRSLASTPGAAAYRAAHHVDTDAATRRLTTGRCM